MRRAPLLPRSGYLRAFCSAAILLLCVLLFGETGTRAADPPTFLYTNNNTAGGNTVSAFNVNLQNGTLSQIGTYATGGFGSGGGYFAAQRALVCGTRLYVSNDGNNTISGFSINATTGVLTPLAGSPYASGGTAADGTSLDCTPNGQMLIAASGGSNTLSVFFI